MQTSEFGCRPMTGKSKLYYAVVDYLWDFDDGFSRIVREIMGEFGFSEDLRREISDLIEDRWEEFFCPLENYQEGANGGFLQDFEDFTEFFSEYST